jgi:hypothetical protein
MMRDVLAGCVQMATAAPSPHNSQPWLFRIDGSGTDVYADAARCLPVLARPDLVARSG